jgi:hypothetical protein
MLQELCEVHTIEAVQQSVTVGAGMGVTRTFNFDGSSVRNLKCRVMFLSAIDTPQLYERGVITAAEIYFVFDPQLDETYRLRFNGTILRMKSQGINDQSIDILWYVVVQAMSEDNPTKVEPGEP